MLGLMLGLMLRLIAYLSAVLEKLKYSLPWSTSEPAKHRVSGRSRLVNLYAAGTI